MTVTGTRRGGAVTLPRPSRYAVVPPSPPMNGRRSALLALLMAFPVSGTENPLRADPLPSANSETAARSFLFQDDGLLRGFGLDAGIGNALVMSEADSTTPGPMDGTPLPMGRRTSLSATEIPPVTGTSTPGDMRSPSSGETMEPVGKPVCHRVGIYVVELELSGAAVFESRLSPPSPLLLGLFRPPRREC
jgi:hypothetical protein